MSKIRIVFIAFLVLIICVSSQAQIPETTIIENGSSDYEIVVTNADNRYGLRFASTELRHFLKKMTGVELPIVNSKSDLKKSIFLRQIEAIPPGAFAVTIDNNENVYIFGNNCQHTYTSSFDFRRPFYTGTLNGIYALLRQQGCEWFWSGELGEIVPNKTTIKVHSEIDYPRFRYVCPTSGPKSNNGDYYRGIWAIRHGALNVDGLFHNHNWHKIMGITGMTQGDVGWCQNCDEVEPPSDESPMRCGHPEFMAMVPGVNGTHMDFHDITPYDPMANRICNVANAKSQGGQVCTSNAGTIEAFRSYIDWYFQSNSNFQTISISPNDGGGFCECINCRRLDGSFDRTNLYGDIDGDGDVDQSDFGLWQTLDEEIKEQINLHEFTWTEAKEWNDFLISPDENQFNYGKNRLTDRMLSFYKSVAEEASKTNPGKRICGYVYGYFKHLPLRQYSLPSNLELVLAINDASRLSDWQIEQDRLLIEGWSSLHPGHMASLHDIGCWQNLGTIQPLGSQLTDRIHMLHNNGFKGYLLYLGGTWEEFGLDSYLFMKLSWNPDFDIEKLTNDYYDCLYGNASSSVREFYDTITNRRQKAIKNVFRESPPTSFQGLAPMTSIIVQTYEPIIDQLNTMIEEAVNKTSDEDDKTKQRLERLIDSWNLTKGTVKAIRNFHNLTTAPVDVAHWEKYIEGVDERKAVLMKWLESSYGRTAYSRATSDERSLLIDYLKTSSAIYTMPCRDNVQQLVYESPMDELDIEKPISWYFGPTIQKKEIVEENENRFLKIQAFQKEISKAYCFWLQGFENLIINNPGNKWIQLNFKLKTKNFFLPRTARGNILFSYYCYYDSGYLHHNNSFGLFAQDYEEWKPVSVFAKIPSNATNLKFRICSYGSGEIFIDDVKIYLYQSPAPTVPIIWESLKKHQKNGFEIEMPIILNVTSPTSECRKDGIDKVRISFCNPISKMTNTVAAISENFRQECSSQTLSNNKKQLELIFVPSLKHGCYTINLNNCISNLQQNKCSNSIEIRSLSCDVNNDGKTNMTDVAFMKSKMNQSLLWCDAKFDLNLDGYVNWTDLGLINLNDGNSVNCPDD